MQLNGASQVKLNQGYAAGNINIILSATLLLSPSVVSLTCAATILLATLQYPVF